MTAPVLVTGATGFVGRAVVDALLAAGHPVRAVVRPGTDPANMPWASASRLEVARVDLRQRRGLDDAVAGSSAVVHLAAVKSGDLAARFAGTVVTTEHLLDAMTTVDVDRLVLCSTFAVYDYLALARGALLTEDAPVEDEPRARDEYAQVKLAQEQLVAAWSGRTTVIRPGLVYGRGELWHSLLGIELAGPWWLGAGSRRVLPMAWVENVADAFVAAVEHDASIGETLNVVDDDLPTVGEYVAAVGPLVPEAPQLIRLPYRATEALVDALDVVNRSLFHGRLELPSGLRPAPFAARFRPLRYSNARAKDVLRWAPRVDLRTALARCTASPLGVEA